MAAGHGRRPARSPARLSGGRSRRHARYRGRDVPDRVRQFPCRLSDRGTQRDEILRDPFTNKPFVHFYATKRVGGQVLDSAAIKLLRSERGIAVPPAPGPPVRGAGTLFQIWRPHEAGYRRAGRCRRGPRRTETVAGHPTQPTILAHQPAPDRPRHVRGVHRTVPLDCLCEETSPARLAPHWPRARSRRSLRRGLSHDGTRIRSPDATARSRCRWQRPREAAPQGRRRVRFASSPAWPRPGKCCPTLRHGMLRLAAPGYRERDTRQAGRPLRSPRCGGRGGGCVCDRSAPSRLKRLHCPSSPQGAAPSCRPCRDRQRLPGKTRRAGAGPACCGRSSREDRWKPIARRADRMAAGRPRAGRLNAIEEEARSRQPSLARDRRQRQRRLERKTARARDSRRASNSHPWRHPAPTARWSRGRTADRGPAQRAVRLRDRPHRFLRARAEQRPAKLRAVLLEYRFRLP